MRRLLLGFSGALLMTELAVAADRQRPTVAESIHLFLGKEDPAFFNGGLIVAREGKPVDQRVSGIADFAAKTPLRSDAVFQLASAAKPFTSTAVLQLRDRGLLKLDDPVARHLPGFPYPAITVRNLLSHSSGLPDLELFEPLIAAKPDHVVSGADLIPALVAWPKPLRFPAGGQFRYSNINYQLLAQLVAKVSGKPFGTYMRDRVFKPAGMLSSYVKGTRAAGRHRDPVANQVLAVMFRTEPEDVRRLDYPDKIMMRPYRYEGFNMGSTVGDQNVFSTLEDLMRFDAALRSGRILSLRSQQEAYAPLRFNNGSFYAEPGVYDLYAGRCSYGMGWEVCTHPARGRMVGHSGYSRGIATMFYRELDTGRAAAMFDNGDTGDFPKKFASLINVVHGEAPVEIDRRHSLTRDYGKTLVADGPVAALIRYNRLKSETGQWITTAAGMNRLGYDLLRNGYPALALDAFRLNLSLNPGNANFYDSYAEGLAANGRKADAILAYRRSLELKPDNAKGLAALKALEAAN